MNEKMTGFGGLEFMLNEETCSPQEGNALCGVAVGKAFLYNCLKIPLTTAEFIERAQTGHEIIEETQTGAILKRHNIVEDGVDEPNWDKLANYHNLNVYKDPNGDIDKLKHVLELGLWPIVHRPFEEDGDGHYIIVHNVNGKVQFFDPSKEIGGFKEESYEEFYNKWYLDSDGERWFMVMYDKTKHPIPVKTL